MPLVAYSEQETDKRFSTEIVKILNNADNSVATKKSEAKRSLVFYRENWNVKL